MRKLLCNCSTFLCVRRLETRILIEEVCLTQTDRECAKWVYCVRRHQKYVKVKAAVTPDSEVDGELRVTVVEHGFAAVVSRLLVENTLDG